MKNSTIIVAAIQHRSEPGAFEDNLRSAETFIQQAVEKRARLIVLPELFAAGYTANERIFSLGETADGPTLTWMKEQSSRHRVFLGGGVPLYENGHLYNRFYIFDPSGEICGYAQKHWGESYCFKRDEGRYVVNTDIGRIGVSICADSHVSSVVADLRELDIDILLMPHAWPTMETGSQDEHEFALIIAHLLNIPIVLVNGVGKIAPLQGLFGKLMTPQKFQLRGKSCIISAEGKKLDSLHQDPGILVHEITTGKSSKEEPAIPNYDGWIHPGSRLLRSVLFPLEIWRGKKAYEKNRFRRRAG
jgi:N-carbamoylputrescine amidase